MKLNRTWVLRALALLGLLALWWGISPAWTLWRTHAMQFDQLARQRIAMQSDQQEAQALQKKTVLPQADALSQIKATSGRLLGAVPQTLAGNTVQIQIKAVSADQLALAWGDIRKLTSAMVVKADLNANGQGWSGTLVFKLAQQP
jgi:hypothetical protein